MALVKMSLSFLRAVHWILAFIPQHYISFLFISSQSRAVYGTQHGNKAPWLRRRSPLVRPWIERMPIPCSPFLPGVARCTGHRMETSLSLATYPAAGQTGILWRSAARWTFHHVTSWTRLCWDPTWTLPSILHWSRSGQPDGDNNWSVCQFEVS